MKSRLGRLHAHLLRKLVQSIAERPELFFDAKLIEESGRLKDRDIVMK